MHPTAPSAFPPRSQARSPPNETCERGEKVSEAIACRTLYSTNSPTLSDRVLPSASLRFVHSHVLTYIFTLHLLANLGGSRGEM
jgi:hypothetical protein